MCEYVVKSYRSNSDSNVAILTAAVVAIVTVATAAIAILPSPELKLETEKRASYRLRTIPLQEADFMFHVRLKKGKLTSSYKGMRDSDPHIVIPLFNPNPKPSTLHIPLFPSSPKPSTLCVTLSLPTKPQKVR